MFKKLVKKLLAARSSEDLAEALYGAEGVKGMFEKGKITWDEHETLYELAGRLVEWAEAKE